MNTTTMEKFRYYSRLSILLLLLAAFLLIAGARLYNLQITHGADNLRQAERRLVRTVTVPAARGEILDRYGRPLVQNRLSYSVRLDMARLKKDAHADEVIYRLITLMRDSGVSYEDTFPVTAPPFSYVADMTDRQTSRLNRFLEKKGWVGLSAHDLMTRLRELYKVPGEYGDAQARDIVAIWYEMDLRTLFFNVPAYQFASDINITLVAKLKEQDFPGVQVETVPIREYRTKFAAHLLGRVGQIPEEQLEDYKAKGYAADEIVGLDGMESALEDWLHGTAGKRTEETTTAGKVTSILYSEPPQPGNNCLLTIDIRLQEQVEYALESNILRLREEGAINPKLEGGQAAGGAAVVIDVKTGEVLALANYPTFDLSQFNQNYAEMMQDPMTPMVNRALAGTYEPGSTFKMCAALAALETGAITTKTRIVDKGRYMRFAPSYTPSCSIYRSGGSTHGSLDVSNALRVSCNYFFYEVGWLTGIDAMNDYSRRLGLGVLTGIDLPGERAGVLAGPEYCKEKGIAWNGGDVIQSAIGQSYNLFTPLQLSVYTATVASGGTRYTPHLLKTVKSYSYDETVYDMLPAVAEQITFVPENLAAVRSGMRMVAQPGGTASGTFGSYSIPVAAKTGSAQVKADGSPANGVFVAYAPYDDPQIAVAVVVEKGGAGSRVAPIARDIFDAYFQGQQNMDSLPAQNSLQR